MHGVLLDKWEIEDLKRELKGYMYSTYRTWTPSPTGRSQKRIEGVTLIGIVTVVLLITVKISKENWRIILVNSDAPQRAHRKEDLKRELKEF